MKIKTSFLKKALILLLCTTVVLALTSYTLWQKNQAMIRDNYRMYLKSQYNLRDLLTNSLKVQYQRTKLIDSLALVKGEFIVVEHILEQVTIPENLQSFHKRGLYICNQAFSNAVQGKPTSSNMRELAGYKEELDQLLLQLNSSKVIDNSTPESIYQKLEDAGNEIEQQ